jgi:hypothetical protein
MPGDVLYWFYGEMLALPTAVYASLLLLFAGYYVIGIGSDVPSRRKRIALGLVGLLSESVVYYQAVYPDPTLIEQLTFWSGLVYFPLFGTAFGLFIRRNFRTEANALLLSVTGERTKRQLREELGIEADEPLLWAFEDRDGQGES